mmetsp:Transcript_122028/g.304524  ORF Transcript_122028/g.304524 Transcript_122028/m.304524 type:complete len:729 (-) Transcript_122028:131-2317(-)
MAYPQQTAPPMGMYHHPAAHPSMMMHHGSRLDLLEAEVNHIRYSTPPSASMSKLPGMVPSPTKLGGSEVLDFGSLSGASTGASSNLMDTTMASSADASVAAPGHHAYHQLFSLYKDAVTQLNSLQVRHTQLMSTHQELMMAHYGALQYAAETESNASTGPAGAPKKQLKKHPCMGVIRLDYNYPPADGDTDSPASFGFDVTYRVVPGMTFEIAQAGKFTEAVERRFAEGIKFLEQKGVNAITGDCGFMMAFQVLARKIATVPVFMSSMVQCPVIGAAFDAKDQILILTANGNSLKPQKDVLLNHCGFDVEEDRFVIRGCQDIPGFDAVAKGQAVPIDIVQPGMVKMTADIIRQNPRISGILLECTELPPYADALRASTGLPVWDAVTAADFYISGFKDNPRFGIDDWQAEWDQDQEEYAFGQNLIAKDKDLLVNKTQTSSPKKAAKPKSKAAVQKLKKLKKKQAPCLGVIRLDYNYPPAAGDIDCPGSYGYDVLFRCVPGLTFEMAQSGMMTYQVQQQFVSAVHWLESKGVCGITGDCGFMMAFQPLARDIASVPVFMSSMVQCPMISVAFDKYDVILILTANSKTLEPQKNVLLKECGFDVDDTRFLIEGCQNIDGFDAVAKGEKVDVERVTPGMVKMVQDLLSMQPNIRAILLECTELPPYADALRQATGLPVWDAITCADFFISCCKDNPRFGLNQWQNDWDGTIDEYKLGENLTGKQKGRLLHK